MIRNQELMALEIAADECLRWVEDCYRLKTESVMPAKLSLVPKDGIFYNVMPSILPARNTMGCKIVNRYPDRQPSLCAHMLLYHLEDGSLREIMEADYITSLRTGSNAAYVMRRLAPPRVRRIGLIGLGEQMRQCLRVYLGSQPEMPLELCLLRHHGHEEAFTEFIRQIMTKTAASPDEIHISYAETVRECVENSDIVVSAPTYLAEDIAAAEWFKPGALLVPIHTRGFMSCDLVFDRIIGDDRSQIEKFRYFKDYREFVELGEVIRGQHPGRRHADERIIAYNIGISLLDVYFADQLLRRCQLNLSGEMSRG